VGDAAPSVVLLDPATGEVDLSQYWTRRPAVLVFLRYFGCPFCQMQVVALREDQQRFAEVGADIVLVGQGDLTREAAFREARHVPFPILLDAGRLSYRAYGLGRATTMQIFGPRVALPFVRANLNPETMQRGLKGGSFRQLPGTFVVDTEGIVRLAHRNRTVADNPSNAVVLEALRAIRDRAAP
jgi:prostamide/prostaglandin F2alpha synthase